MQYKVDTRLEKARKEIAVANLSQHPKNKYGAYLCNKQHPMPPNVADIGRWGHEDVKETDYDSDYYIEYQCKTCGHKFKTEMPD